MTRPKANIEDTLALLEALIAFPTVSARSNLELIDYVRSRLAQIGVESELVFNEARTKANLFASIGPRDLPGIVFSGHTDVVPAEGQPWSRDPFRLAIGGSRAFARGTADMKGFLACALATFEGTDPTRLQRPVQLAFSYDEEIGCVGVRGLLDRWSAFAAPPALCLIGEPTLMRPAIAHKGKIAARAICTGREGHSADAPQGLNAIHLACDMIGALRARQDGLAASARGGEPFSTPYTTLHVGTIQGGTALNIVPRECRFDFEIRNIPSDDPEAILAALFDEAARLTQAARTRFPDAGVALEVVNRYPALATSRQSPALAELQRLLRSDAALGLSFGTEGGLYAQKLGAEVIVCGPGSIDDAHRADESIEISQLAACLDFLDGLVEDMAA